MAHFAAFTVNNSIYLVEIIIFISSTIKIIIKFVLYYLIKEDFIVGIRRLAP